MPYFRRAWKPSNLGPERIIAELKDNKFFWMKTKKGTSFLLLKKEAYKKDDSFKECDECGFPVMIKSRIKDKTNQLRPICPFCGKKSLEHLNNKNINQTLSVLKSHSLKKGVKAP